MVTLDAGRLRRMVEGASTLDERLGGGFEALPSPSDIAETRLAGWMERVAQGDPARFERRLRWDGLDHSRVRLALGEARLPDDAPLPTWAVLVRDALALPACPCPEVGEPEDPGPFGELVFPFVRIARKQVAEGAGAGCALLTPSAWAGLEMHLLRLLARCCAPTLHVEFEAFRAVDSAGLLDPASARTAFVERMRGGGMASLLLRLPVLARLLGTLAERWAESATELVERLRADQGLLADVFSGGAAAVPVARIQAGLSDPHRGGRTVALLELASGARVVYKPRGTGRDVAWQRLLGWLNRTGAGLPLRTLRVVDRGTHGWMEWAAAEPRRGAEEEARYRERLGMILCLAYALGGSDFHDGNLLACGEDPVVVDLEVLLAGPVARGGHGGEAADAAWESVVRTHLLPAWRKDGGGASLPAGDGPFLRGFGRTYRLLVRRRDELLAPGGPLEELAGYETRLVIRDTRGYAALLARSLHPRLLARGVERSLEIDALAGTHLDRPDPPPLWGLLSAERRDLEAGDVPLFTVPADGVGVADSGSAPTSVRLRQPGYEDAVDRLTTMDDADLAAQEELIRTALVPRPAPRSPAPDAPAAAVDLMAEVGAIADFLCRLAIPSADGGVTWGGVLPGRGAQRSRLGRVDHSLGHGRAGIALFLAAYARADGRDAYRDLALRAVAPLAASLRRAPWRRRLARTMGVGGFSGVGGLAYALARIGALADSPEVLRGAGEAARAITRRCIVADGRTGVAEGSAGAALALLALYRTTGDPDALRRARLCGRHLVGRCAGAGGPGFADGDAGIACALARLHGATGEHELLRAARALLARTGWDLASLDDSWCRGAAGIALARSVLRDSGAPVDDDAPAAVARRPLASRDHLCCGNLGVVECLLAAAVRLDRPELLHAARTRADEVVLRARRRGSYATGIPDRYAPGLMGGLAGIGYGLLRLCHPALAPSVLLLE